MAFRSIGTSAWKSRRGRSLPSWAATGSASRHWPALSSGCFVRQPAEYVFGGEDVTRADARRRAMSGIGYVPQGREIFGRLTVEENLSLGTSIGARSKLPRHLPGRVRVVPNPARAAVAKRRYPEWRSATDAGHRPCSDGETRNCLCSTNPRTVSSQALPRRSPC